ncbi:hypothetical protein ACFFWC_21215 [Plantactinospora siamensis]|uniref:Uncharacterized protein n=1 Tax=Plantactinospora siamensis TaxID=555372 RepID=A0ABV6P5N8_9ACTN
MRIRRTGRRDAEAMERMLDTPGREAGAEPVARLLAAAAAPPRPGELAGEERALAAFRQAARAPGRPAPARSWRRRLTAGAAAWAAIGATTVTAGVALAAGTHVFTKDGPVDRPSTTPAPAPGQDGTSAATAPGGVIGSPGASISGPAGTVGPGSAAPEIVGLCKAYLHKDPVRREKALRSPSYQRLVTAAGGAAGVEAYCAGVVASPAGGPPTVPPGQASTPPGQATVPPGQVSTPPGQEKTPTPKAKQTPKAKPTKPESDAAPVASPPAKKD